MSGQILTRPASPRHNWLGRLPGLIRRHRHHRRPALLPIAELLQREADHDQDAHECLQLLAQVQAEASQARTLGELKSHLPVLEAEGASAVAAAVLHHLICRLEAPRPEVMCAPLDEDILRELLLVLPLSRLEQLFARGFSLYTASRPCLAAEGPHSVRAETLSAGLSSSGFLLAAMGARAETEAGQKALWEMLTPEAGPGLFSVRFPGRAPVMMALPSAAERLMYASAGSDGFWPALIEKAAACICPLALPDADNGPAPQLQAALELFSGGEAEVLDAAMTPLTRLRGFIEASLNARCLTVAAANQYHGQAALEPQGEAFTICAFDFHTDQLLLRRMPGQGLPRDAEGLPPAGACETFISINLSDFTTYFSHIGAAAPI